MQVILPFLIPQLPMWTRSNKAIVSEGKVLLPSMAVKSQRGANHSPLQSDKALGEVALFLNLIEKRRWLCFYSYVEML